MKSTTKSKIEIKVWRGPEAEPTAAQLDREVEAGEKAQLDYVLDLVK